MSAFVGVDLGGTKLRIQVNVDGVVIRDDISSSAALFRVTLSERGRMIAARIRDLLPAGIGVAAVAAGAHGCDSEAQCVSLADGIRAELPPGTAVLVVNDGLLIPATLDDPHTAVGLVIGTGCVAVGLGADGALEVAGGWGWLLGDEGSAAGIVREAAKAVLRHTETRPHAADPLVPALLAAFEVDTPGALPEAVSTASPDDWAARCPVVFAAAEADSRLAREVIAAAVDHLVHLVEVLRRRGIDVASVAAAGGVIVAQPRLGEQLRTRLAQLIPPVRLAVVTAPPVAGASALAHTLAVTQLT